MSLYRRCFLAGVLTAVALLLWWNEASHPDRDLLGTWIRERSPDADSAAVARWYRDGTTETRYVFSGGARLIMAGRWRCERRAGQRILWTRWLGCSSPRLRARVVDPEREYGALIEVDGDRLRMKCASFDAEGRPSSTRLPSLGFLPEEAFNIHTWTRR